MRTSVDGILTTHTGSLPRPPALASAMVARENGALVLVDAVPMGEAPGTLAVIEPEASAAPTGGDDVAPVVDAHSMSPGVVLGMLAGLGGSVERIVVVGCEPAILDDGIGLSPAVAAAVEPAVELCRGLLTEMTEPLAKDAPG